MDQEPSLSADGGTGPTGSLYGTVVDPDGQDLPGVTITLTGPDGENQTTVSDARGQFRFLGLSPGTYDLKLELDGFSPIQDQEVSIRSNRNTTLGLTLDPAVEDVITINPDVPLLDERRLGDD